MGKRINIRKGLTNLETQVNEVKKERKENKEETNTQISTFIDSYNRHTVLLPERKIRHEVILKYIRDSLKD